MASLAATVHGTDAYSSVPRSSISSSCKRSSCTSLIYTHSCSRCANHEHTHRCFVLRLARLLAALIINCKTDQTASGVKAMFVYSGNDHGRERQDGVCVTAPFSFFVNTTGKDDGKSASVTAP